MKNSQELELLYQQFCGVITLGGMLLALGLFPLPFLDFLGIRHHVSLIWYP